MGPSISSYTFWVLLYSVRDELSFKNNFKGLDISNKMRQKISKAHLIFTHQAF